MLWDIDGTLMRSPGIGVRAFVRAVESVTGVVWTPQRLDFGGRTDPDIAARMLDAAGVDDLSLVPAVLARLADAYEEMADELRAAVVVLPGVEATLHNLRIRGAVQTVVTGNIRPAAVAKIAAAGLDAHLRMDVGAYGSDHHDRSELVALAIQRLEAVDGVVHRDAVIVVGDTPRDLAAARANGIRCVLVATGTYGIDELRALDADLVVADLSEPDALSDALT